MGGLTRFGGFLLWVLLVYRVQTVTCQATVQGFIGDSVLLPCVYSGTDPRPDSVSVFWRDEGNRNVLDIKNNAPDPSTQESRFKNRVSSFQDQYKSGNFSILMRDVQQSDGGTYECNIPRADFQKRVSLSVSGRRDAATPPPGPAGGAAVTPSSLHPLLLSLPLCWVFTSLS